MKKVLFILPFLSGGGAERVVSILASELVKIGVDVHLLVFYRVKDEYTVDKRVGIHVIKESKNEYNNLSKFTKLIYIRKKLKDIKPYVVIPFIYHVGIMTTIAKSGLNIKIVETIRNNPRTEPSSKIFRVIRNASIMFSNKCIMQNKSQLEYFPNYIQRKSQILFNPIGTEYLNKYKQFRKAELNNIVAIGRLEYQKDYYTMIDSTEIAIRNNKNVKLNIYGEGSLFEELNNYIKIKNLDDNVKLCGRTNDVIKVLLEADIYVLSSKWEGMPNSLMEAMAVGLPCISSDCETGPSDLIENGVNGMLVTVGDRNAFAEAIQWMLENIESSIIMGQNARKTILTKCSPQESAKKLLSLLETL